MKKLFIMIVILMASATAQAGLILHISPDGASGTRWEFIGSTTALSSSSNNSFWGENSGTLANTYSGSHSILTGSGTLFSSSGGTHSVINLWASEHTFDGIAPRVSGISWSVGDILSWSGDITSDLLFANLNLGTITTHSILGTTLSESLTITVSNTAMRTIPEPSTIAILALGIMALASRRFKQ